MKSLSQTTPDDKPLQVTGEVITPARMLTPGEALTKLDGLVAAARAVQTPWHEFARQVYDFDRRQGWRALKYGSLWDCLKTEKDRMGLTGLSAKYCLSLAAQGRALAQGAPEKSTSNALTQFAKLNDDTKAQDRAFKDARQSSPDARVTATTAAKSVRRHRKTKSVQAAPERKNKAFLDDMLPIPKELLDRGIKCLSLARQALEAYDGIGSEEIHQVLPNIDRVTRTAFAARDKRQT